MLLENTSLRLTASSVGGENPGREGVKMFLKEQKRK